MEEDIPMCSKMLKNNHIGNVPVSEPPKVIEKVIPSRENGPVSRNGNNFKLENVLKKKFIRVLYF